MNMKKRNKFIFLATLSTACLLSLASCQGAQGPKGDQGTPGINGTNGTDGKDGQDGQNGKSVLSGKGVPASSLGTDGDSYIDTETFDFYVKASGAWLKEGNIKGSTGDKGDTGDSGSKGEDGTSIRTGKGEPSESLGNDGDSYIDLSTFDFYVKADGKWSNEGNIKGDKGDKGDKGNNGSNGSAGTDGQPGKDGATAWSNTILPSANGYVTVDKGSAIAGDYVTFEFVPDTSSNYKLTSLTINDCVSDGTTTTYLQLATSKSDEFGDVNKLRLKMVAGGFVVKATFGTTDPVTVAIIGSDGKEYSSLQDAVKSPTCSKVTLNGEVTLTGDLEIPATKTFELDLNGKNLTGEGTINVYGTLNLTNSGGSEAEIKVKIVVDKNGKYNPGSQKSIRDLFGGYSTFSTRGLQTYTSTSSSSDTLSIGNKVNIASTTGTAITVKSGSLSVVGKVSTTSGTAIEVLGGSVEVAGKVSSTSGKALDVKPISDESKETSVTVASGATVSTTEGTAVAVSAGELKVIGEVNSTASSKAAVEVTGGSVTVEGTVSSASSTAISVAQSGTETTVTLKGTVSGTKAVTVASGTLNVVEGGSVKGSTNGIEVKGGSVTVSGGTVESTSSQASTGAAISVVQGDSSLVETKVTVTGGKVESNSASAVSVSKAEGTSDTAQIVNVNLKGGSYTTNSNDKKAIEDNTTGADDSSKIITQGTDVKYGVKIDINDNEGGTLTSYVNNVAVDSAAVNDKVTFILKANDGYYLKSLSINGTSQTITGTQEISGTFEYEMKSATGVTAKVEFGKFAAIANNTNYKSFKLAYDSGATEITLQNDCTFDGNLDITRNLKINLNGHNLTTTTGRLLVTGNATLEFTGKGKVEATGLGKENSFIKITNDGNSTGKVIIGKGVTIKSNAAGVLVGWNTNWPNTKAEVEVNGTIEATGCSALSVQGTHARIEDPVKITINEGAVIKNDGATCDAALYLAGYANTTINGGTISSSTISAIEIRAGKLTIEDGTFESTSEFEQKDKNVSKSESATKGVGLAVVQHTTMKDIEVVVNGGTFKGAKGLYAADVQENGADATKNVEIKLNGGTFEGSDASIDVRNNIKCTVVDAVNRKGDVNGVDGKALVSTGAELKAALENKDVTYIKLTKDISDLNTKIEIKDGHSVTLDLNDHTLKHNPASGSDYKLFVVSNESTLTIKGNNKTKSKIETDSQYTSNGNISMFVAETKSSIICENISVKTSFTAFFPEGNAAKVSLNNCVVDAGCYAVGTNAGSGDNYGVDIDIKNSTLKAKGDNGNDGDCCTVCINVGGTLDIENSSIYGHRQAVMVRAGTATIKNSTIEADLSHSKKTNYIDSDWGSGNEVPSYPLVIGDTNKDAYNADAICNLSNVTINNTCTNSQYQDRCIYLANDGSSYKTELNYDANCKFGKSALSDGNLRFAKGASVTVNGKQYNKED